MRLQTFLSNFFLSLHPVKPLFLNHFSRPLLATRKRAGLKHFALTGWKRLERSHFQSCISKAQASRADQGLPFLATTDQGLSCIQTKNEHYTCIGSEVWRSEARKQLVWGSFSKWAILDPNFCTATIWEIFIMYKPTHACQLVRSLHLLRCDSKPGTYPLKVFSLTEQRWLHLGTGHTLTQLLRFWILLKCVAQRSLSQRKMSIRNKNLQLWKLRKEVVVMSHAVTGWCNSRE